MEVSNNLSRSGKFTFWIYYIERTGIFGYKISLKKVVKCLIDNNSIRTDEPFKKGLSPLNIPLGTVMECHTMLLHDTSPYLGVNIKTNNNVSTVIIPVNPFDPSSFFHHNDEEATAMVAIIKSLKTDQSPDYDSNPYLRQLKQRDIPKIVQGFQAIWDEDVSPWDYYRKYQSRADKKRWIINIASVMVYIILLIVIIIYSISKLCL